MEFATRTTENGCYLEARKESQSLERYSGHKSTDEKVEEYMPTSALGVEAEGVLTKERLALDLQRRNEWRIFLGNRSGTRTVLSEDENLHMDKEADVLTLSGLELFPKVGEQGGEAIAGTLQVRANRFFYTTSSLYFHFHFVYRNVKKAFFQVEDKKKPPLLHFHLYDPIEVGGEKRQNIQFRLVQTPVGQRRSYNDSDKTEKGKQTRDSDHYEDLKNFVLNVEEKLRYIPVSRRYPFGDAELYKMDEFQGDLPSKPATVFNLAFSALVGLVDEPFVVVDLDEIEIVYLRLKSEVIDMTIVFQDFKRDLVQINSIPIDALDRIKDRFDFEDVKYYENSVDLDWGSIVKEIADSPRTIFVDCGGYCYDLDNFEAANYCPEEYFANQMMKVN